MEAGGVEPPIFRMQNERLNQLSYAPACPDKSARYQHGPFTFYRNFPDGREEPKECSESA